MRLITSVICEKGGEPLAVARKIVEIISDR